MTKKDYEKFAAMLRAATPRPSTFHHLDGHVFTEQMKYHANMVQSIASIFANDNPNFNKQKFINAVIGK